MNNPIYLSKIEIDFEMSHRFGLRDSYAWHQKIWKAFPHRDGEKRDFLTRLDETEMGFRLLLQSTHEPQRPDWCPEHSWNTKIIPDSFYHSKHYRFSLLANATKKVKSNRAGEILKNSRRIPLKTREELLNWLERKASVSGFVIDKDKTKTVPRPSMTFLKKGIAGHHAATEFIGILEVIDQSLFQQVAIKGIGPAKAFGFGMLCLVPLS